MFVVAVAVVAAVAIEVFEFDRGTFELVVDDDADERPSHEAFNDIADACCCCC